MRQRIPFRIDFYVRQQVTIGTQFGLTSLEVR